MIPKILHYCWFGRGKMPELALKCMESWKKFLPDYELKLWNEDSFDINSVPYVREAYQARKFAFVTDYVRLYALYHEGGIYMDTDVEALRCLDIFLDLPAFSGFENETCIPTGIMASEKQGEWAKWQLEYYLERHFLLPNGACDLTTNVTIISNSMAEKGFVLKNGKQVFRNMIVIFPKDYFCPKSYSDGHVYLTENTYTIHHFAASWLSPSQKVVSKLVRLIGEDNVKCCIRIKKKIFKWFL